MVCNKCKNIISESSLTCPYCGNKIVEDYFGYQKVNDVMRIQQEQPRKKDNSGKIVLIVLSAVGGFFCLLCMLLFAFSGFGSSGTDSVTSGISYDAVFDVNNTFVFTVNDSNNYNYNVSVRSESDGVLIDSFQLSSGESKSLNYSNGAYDVIVMQGIRNYICLQMTVSDTCGFNNININFDDRNIITTGIDDVSDVYAGGQQNSSIETSSPSVNQDDEKSDNGQQNNNSANSSQNNSSDTFYALTGINLNSTVDGDAITSISYSKIQTGYKMVIEERDCDTTVTTVYFNSDKLLTEMVVNCMGSITKRSFNYNSNNQLLSEIYEYGNGNSEKIQYTYDSDGNMIKKYCSDTIGSAYEIVYEYDPAGNITKSYYNYPYSSVREYEYCDGVVTYSKCSDNGSLNYEEYYTYNSDLQVTSMRILSYDSGSLQQECRREYVYDGFKLKSVSGMYWENGLISGVPTSKKYTYDSNGNISEIDTEDRYSYTKKFTYTALSTEFMYLLDEYCLKINKCNADYFFFETGVSVLS